MTEESRNLCLVVEGLPPVSAEEVGRISTELGREIENYCGGSITVHRIDRNIPVVEI